jgi:hypothetical protein
MVVLLVIASRQIAGTKSDGMERSLAGVGVGVGERTG